jgi:hypothetical protein
VTGTVRVRGADRDADRGPEPRKRGPRGYAVRDAARRDREPGRDGTERRERTAPPGLLAHRGEDPDGDRAADRLPGGSQQVAVGRTPPEPPEPPVPGGPDGRPWTAPDGTAARPAPPVSSARTAWRPAREGRDVGPE